MSRYFIPVFSESTRRDYPCCVLNRSAATYAQVSNIYARSRCKSYSPVLRRRSSSSGWGHSGMRGSIARQETSRPPSVKCPPHFHAASVSVGHWRASQNQEENTVLDCVVCHLVYQTTSTLLGSIPRPSSPPDY